MNECRFKRFRTVSCLFFVRQCTSGWQSMNECTSGWQSMNVDSRGFGLFLVCSLSDNVQVAGSE